MNDLRTTIVPKSDQLNADDFIGGGRTVKITKVLMTGAADQPVAIHYEGGDGKPYKPCKSMRRLLIDVWGADGNEYIGRSMTLYRDPTVTFGADKVGGVRISHVSHIDAPRTVALTVSRGKRKAFTVNPIKAAPQLDAGKLEQVARDVATMGTDALQKHWKSLGVDVQRALEPIKDELKRIAADQDVNSKSENGDDWPGPDPDGEG